MPKLIKDDGGCYGIHFRPKSDTGPWGQIYTTKRDMDNAPLAGFKCELHQSDWFVCAAIYRAEMIFGWVGRKVWIK